MDIHIDKPILNREKPEENIAIIDRWIAETADKLNYALSMMSRERSQEDAKH